MKDNNEHKVSHHGFTDEQLREAGEAMRLQSENTALKLEVERHLSIEQNFRNFIRANHLSSKWDDFLAIAGQALKETNQ